MNPACKRIEVWEGVDEETFRRDIYSAREPAVLRGIPIGPCQSLWDCEYLCKHGGTQPVKIHVSPDRHMNFLDKNFVYRTLPFDELVKRSSRSVQEEYFFMRDGALLPEISWGGFPGSNRANDSRRIPRTGERRRTYPNFLPKEAFFSSVLRVASPQLCLWTHYRCYRTTFLIQVRGRKRAVLFHPNDLEYLYMKGDKSQVLDVDNPDLERYPDFLKATRYEAILDAGDILFIPALWFHNMTALDFGVAVNIFWRHL
uniref:JmjC domain-containing protein n=1 Tax=Ixodes ricinus TaxID=34613 RepID=A0A090XAE1_IXORI